jgi:hypothetical protein
MGPQDSERRPLLDTRASSEVVSLKGFLEDGYIASHGASEDEADKRVLRRYMSFACALLSW